MFLDVVFPHGNESELIEMAERLGIDGLVFTYKFDGNFKAKRALVDGFAKNASILIRFGALVRKDQVRQAKPASDLTVVLADVSLEIFNQSPDIVYGFEQLIERDRTYSRSSGLNIFLLQSAAKKKSTVGFSIDAMLSSVKMDKLLGRTRLNIILTRKYKVSNVPCSFASSEYHLRQPHDIEKLLKLLGMDTASISKSMNKTAQIVQKNRKKKSGQLLAEGIEVVK